MFIRGEFIIEGICCSGCSLEGVIIRGCSSYRPSGILQEKRQISQDF